MPKDWTDIYHRYRGKWVALEHDEETVAGFGDSLQEAHDNAQANGCAHPILMAVPEEVIGFAG